MDNNNILVGTDNSEQLVGTDSNDEIKALAGDDTIIASLGNDTIEGGIGNDIYDYNDTIEAEITINTDNFIDTLISKLDLDISSYIDTILPAIDRDTADYINAIWQQIDLDTDLDTDSSIDNILTEIGINISELSDFGQQEPITVSLDTVLASFNAPTKVSAIGSINLDVDKGQLGRDFIIDTVGDEGVRADVVEEDNSFSISYHVDPLVGKLVAPVGENNIFEADPAWGCVIDLGQNLYLDEGGIHIIGRVELTIDNFVNAVGGMFWDSLIGNSENNRLDGGDSFDFLDGAAGDDYLIGGSGDDTLLGGDGNDILLGIDPLFREKSEFSYVQGQDTLTGGGGADLFILGNSEGSFYKSNSEAEADLVDIGISDLEDYASIEDYAADDLIQLSAKETYVLRNAEEQLELFVIQGTREDLIASVANTNIGISDGAIGDILLAEPWQINPGETLEIFVGAEV